MDEIAQQLDVTGRVQGVGYRAFLCREAEARGLRGWVMNRADGSVRAVLAGPAAALNDLEPALRRGPPASAVAGIARAAADAAALPAGAGVAIRG
ncbi:acylphosphatase [Roseivivax sp. CAU 1761]